MSKEAEHLQKEKEDVQVPLMNENADVSKIPIVVEDVPVGVEASFNRGADQVQVKEPPKFVGLTKEELSKYENDPFWRKLRLSLFILFWLAWIAMFAAAIAIVVLSPKCPEKPVRFWWQKGVCQQIYVRSFKDSDKSGVGDLKGVADSLSQLKKINVRSIWPTYLLPDTDLSGYSPESFTEIAPEIGSADEFKQLVDAAHSHGISVVVDLVLSMTSRNHPWFKGAEAGDGDMEARYIVRSAPGGAAQHWSQLSGSKHYRHFEGFPGRPLLNLENENVKKLIQENVRFWLQFKVDGIHIVNKYLAPVFGSDTDENFNNYLNVFRSIRETFNTHKNETGSTSEVALFTSLPAVADESLRHRLRRGWVGAEHLDFVIDGDLTQIDETCDADCLKAKLRPGLSFYEQHNDTWPFWELGSPHVSRLASRVKGHDRAELLTMLLLLLPGSAKNYYGDEIGIRNIAAADAERMNVSEDLKKNSKIMTSLSYRSPMQWNKDKNAGFSEADNVWMPLNRDYESNNFISQYDEHSSFLKLFKRLALFHESDDTFLYGDFELGKLNSSDILVVLRKNGPFTFVAAMNFGIQNATITADVSLAANSKIAQVVATTSNLATRGTYPLRQNRGLDKLELATNEGILLKFKPL